MKPVEPIHNAQMMSQIHSFEGIQLHKNFSPTDIDLSIDWRSQAFAFGEGKKNNNPLTEGQRIHLRGLVLHLDVPAISFVYRHDVEDFRENVIVKDCLVSEFFTNAGKYKGKGWIEPKDMTVQYLLTHFEKQFFKK